MNEKDIIRAAMNVRGYNQTMLAEQAGLKRQTNVSEMLRSRSIRVDNFVKLLGAMGFEVIVRDKNSANKENTWKVGGAE
jgi:hypothetical protein